MENKSTMIHKENDWEWRFVGIWADMVNDTGLLERLKIYSTQDTLILFTQYERPLEIIQENLRLRNQYNLLQYGDKKEDIKTMEDNIQSQIANLPLSPELCIYISGTDDCLKI